MRITTGGNVGIGTSSPSNVLTVTRNQNATSRIAITNSDTTNTSSRAGFQATSGAVSVDMLSITGLSGLVGTSTNHPLELITNGNGRVYVDTSGNVFVGGTTQNTANAPVYSKTNAKAWVRFNGSALTVTASHNVSSVSRFMTGGYTFNFASALADANWCGVSSTSDTSGQFGVETWVNTWSTTSGNTYSGNLNGTYYNDTGMQVIIFGN